MKSINWNPWFGCHKCSTGCSFCWVSDKVIRNSKEFNLPLRKQKKHRKYKVELYELQYKIEPGTVINVCPNSDFFIEDADYMRDEAWWIMHDRPDCLFNIVTKRPERIRQCLPRLWLDGWDNVMISISVEDNFTLGLRGEQLLELSNIGINHLGLVLEPLIEEVDIIPYIGTGLIDQVIVGGENYCGVMALARTLDIGWVTKIKEQCELLGVPFVFRSTGSRFRVPNGQVVNVKYYDQQGLASFYGLSLYNDNNFIYNWERNIKDLELRELAENARKVYYKIKQGETK